VKTGIVVLAIALIVLPVHPAGSAERAPEPSGEAIRKILDDFERYAIQGMGNWKVPGMAIALVRGDETLYEKAFGVREQGKADPVTVDTIFQIGSTSKAFTSALVAMLVDEGKAAWTDRVVDHLSDFMLYDPWVTREFRVADLMAQHSGMAAHALDGLVMIGYGRDRVIDSLRYVKPATSFRSAFAYQNNLFLVAAKLIERKTGKTWEENVRERIFAPLGMSASSCDMRSFVTAKNAATLHREIDGKIVTLPMDWEHLDWVYTYAPAGGVNASVKDAAKWIRMQAANGFFEGRKIISEENAKFLHTPQTPTPMTDPVQCYCQGWVWRQASPYPIIWHNGGTSGSKTMIAFIPEAKLGIVVVSNLIDTMLPEALAYRFFDLYFGNPLRDWSREELDKVKEAAPKAAAGKPVPPATAEPAMPLERYAGEYSNPVYGAATVMQKGDGLVFTFGPRKTEIRLRHWDRDVFMGSWSYYGVPEDAGFVAFRVAADGRPVEVALEGMNEDGCGTFTRVVKP